MLSWLLRLPLSPVTGVVWVGEQVLTAAEQELYDEGHIRRDLLELERDLEAGRISTAEYEEAEEVYLERLVEAKQRRGNAQE